MLTLHAQKRKLYEDLVADADGGGKLDIDALAALLDDAGEAPRPVEERPAKAPARRRGATKTTDAEA